MALNMLFFTEQRNQIPIRPLNYIVKNYSSQCCKTVLAMVLVLTSLSAFAQKPSPEELRQQEQLKKARLLQLMDSGVYYMNTGKYDIADQKFVYVLNNIRSVPSDLTFYFGKNSFHQAKYKQSIDWLDKYMQLKGMTGSFSNEAGEMIRKAKSELLKEKSQEIKKTDAVMSNKYEIDCGPSGIVTCPVCKGAHVVIKKRSFGDEYKTCPYCSEQGTLTCEEYNKLSRGELKPK